MNLSLIIIYTKMTIYSMIELILSYGMINKNGKICQYF